MHVASYTPDRSFEQNQSGGCLGRPRHRERRCPRARRKILGSSLRGGLFAGSLLQTRLAPCIGSKPRCRAIWWLGAAAPEARVATRLSPKPRGGFLVEYRESEERRQDTCSILQPHRVGSSRRPSRAMHGMVKGGSSPGEKLAKKLQCHCQAGCRDTGRFPSPLIWMASSKTEAPRHQSFALM